MDNVDVACARYIQDIVVRPSHPDSSIYLFPHLPAYYFNDRLILWTMWMLRVRDTYKTLSSVLHIQTHPFTCFPICQLTTLTTVLFYTQGRWCVCFGEFYGLRPVKGPRERKRIFRFVVSFEELPIGTKR